VSVRPLFVFSLPRAGSTLLQRMLAAHPRIATSSEPWLLLPQLYALRPYAAQAEYGHRTAARALHDFCEALPAGRDAYLAEVHRTTLALYEQAAGGADWFLDKTPRYHFIVDEVMELFPEGRFVFLWRNPLAVAASIIESFGRGRWNLDRYAPDLHGGLERLYAASRRDDPRACILRYEDLVADPAPALEKLFAFLDLPHDPGAAERFASVELEGRMGDRTGRVRYSTITTESIDRWQETMRNPLRKRWCRTYLEYVGDERLRAMGYDPDALRRQVAGMRSSGAQLGSDVAGRIRGIGGRRSLSNLGAPAGES